MSVPHTVASLRDSLDRDGCAHGQVTRERLDNVLDHIAAVESKLNLLLSGVLLQLVGFVFGVILFLLGHVRVG